MAGYYKPFADRDNAVDWMRGKNRAARKAGNLNDLFVVVDGPDDDFAVVDIDTAIDMEVPYEWATSGAASVGI